MKRLPSQEALQEQFDYDPDSGLLTWRARRVPICNGVDIRIAKNWNARFAGKPALNYIRDNGYRVGTLRGFGSVRSHRVIWKMMTGEEPDQIDHINGDRADNRWPNLRAASTSENARNQRRSAANTSGCTGVYWQKDASLWRVVVKADGKNNQIGYFKTRSEAVRARKAAERKFGFHENHGSDRPHYA